MERIKIQRENQDQDKEWNREKTARNGFLKRLRVRLAILRKYHPNGNLVIPMVKSFYR